MTTLAYEGRICDICGSCGAQLAPGLTACPGCGALLHAQRLTELAQTAKAASDLGDITGALTAWREALALLPAGSRQYQTIAARITQLGQQLGQSGTTPASSKGKGPAGKAAAGLGAIGLTLLKFKTLLLGLTKGTTLITMFLSLAVYCTMWGWKFALGIVLSIYVHEMGHVIALRRLGFKATSPMFIPGLGALIRLQQQVVNPREDAEIGLAGPIYGLGAALVALAIFGLTKMPIFAAIAGVGAWINLFNLTPIGTLDGGRGFHALSRPQKFLAVVTVAGAWAVSHEGLLMVVGIVGLSRAFSDKNKDQAGNGRALATYMALVAVLTALMMVRPVT